MMKNNVLKEIIDNYLNSSDFNGLLLYDVKNYDHMILCELIDEELIEVISENEVLNPHVKLFNLKIPLDLQKQNISSKENHSVLYPTRKALEKLPPDYAKPYSERMRKGESQLKIIYFDIRVLEVYRSNPKFLVLDNGYRGCIELKDEFISEDDPEEYIRDYGMAYFDCDELIRAVGVFVSDLAKLDSNRQLLWKGFEHKRQDSYKINQGFIKNLIQGEWVEEIWIFHALLEEMKIINEQCRAIGIPPLFHQTFEGDYYGMPEGYHSILLPTLKNYYDFILVLEKILVNNLSKKTFVCDSTQVKKVESTDSENKEKGTLRLLKEWLTENIRTELDIEEVIIKPLKEIREIRQIPAHKLIANEYDVTLYEKQKKIMEETYNAIKAIRLLFANHPLARTVEINDLLISGDKIVFY